MEKLLVFIALLCLVKFGRAIMCYECNSATNSFCDDKVLPESLKRNCTEHDRGAGVVHTLCRKIVQHAESTVNGQLPASRVIRSCGWDDSKYKGACYQRAGFGGRQDVCSCTTDFCNTAPAPAAPAFAASLVFLALQTWCLQ